MPQREKLDVSSYPDTFLLLAILITLSFYRFTGKFRRLLNSRQLQS